MDQPIQRPATIQFDIRAVQLGQMRQLQHLRRPVPGIAPQAIGRPLDQPLRRQVDVVHQHLGAHHRNGQRSAQLLILIHLLLVHRLFQPHKIQFLQHPPHFKGLAQVIGAHWIGDQIVIRPHGVPHGPVDGDIGLSSFIRVKLVRPNTHFLAGLYGPEIPFYIRIPAGQIRGQPRPHAPHQRIDR